MEKIITAIVPQLLSKLSTEKPYYTQNDLSGYGFPLFLIKRMTVHLMEELNKEFTLPGKEWVNTDSEDILSEWAELQRSIRREVHLPASLAEEVIGRSVRECVGMTIQPCKVIPELLFEGKDELDINLLTERSSAITVNRFLVWSMLRYMEKKEKQSLSIADAKRIIEAIDVKIVENYHPLNWLSLVKPLFELSGGTVHSDLFRLFFEHKGKNPIAKEFDLVNGEIKESKFIEIISSPNSMYVEGYKDDQQTLFREEAAKDEIMDANLDEDLIEAQDELAEDTPEQIPFHLSFTKDQEDEGRKIESQDEESPEDYILSSEETEEEEDSKSEKFIEDEDEGEGETQEELIAPWDEDEDVIDEEEGTPTLLDAFNTEEESESEVDELAEEDPDGVLTAESELSKEEQQVSDAVLLEIEDEEESESDDEDVKNEGVSIHQTDEPEATDSKSNDKDFELDVNDLDVESDEIEDEVEVEEGALYSKFVSAEEDEEDLNPEESEEQEEDALTNSKSASILEVDSESDDEDEDEDEDEEESESSLLNRFMFDDSDLDDSSLIDKSEPEEKVKTIYDELNLVRNDAEPKTMDLFGSMGSLDRIDTPADAEADKKKTDSQSEEPEVIQKFSDMDESGGKEDSDETEVPMWKSFLEREEEVKSAFHFDDGSEHEAESEKSDEQLDEDGFIEEPIYDFTKKEPDIDEKIGGLSDWMQDVRDKFIEELFGDSEDAYEQALSDIVEFDDWKNASRYIEKEIFTRNRIDVYDEIAVDFTDRLHSYFIENKS